jgi:hypothetical protein
MELKINQILLSQSLKHFIQSCFIILNFLIQNLINFSIKVLFILSTAFKIIQYLLSMSIPTFSYFPHISQIRLICFLLERRVIELRTRKTLVHGWFVSERSVKGEVQLTFIFYLRRGMQFECHLVRIFFAFCLAHD